MKKVSPAIRRARNARRKLLKEKRLASFESGPKTETKPFSLDVRLKAAVQKVVNLLDQSEPHIIRFALIRFLHFLGVIAAELGPVLIDYCTATRILYPVKLGPPTSVPAVEPALLKKIEKYARKKGVALENLVPFEEVYPSLAPTLNDTVLNELKAIPLSLAEIFTSKSGHVNTAGSITIDAEVKVYLTRAARLFDVTEPFFIQVALVNFINCLPKLYEQRGNDFTDYDDATSIVPKMIKKAAVREAVSRLYKQRTLERQIQHETWQVLVDDSLELCRSSLRQPTRRELADKQMMTIKALVRHFKETGERSPAKIKKLCAAAGVESEGVFKRLKITPPKISAKHVPTI